MKFKTRKDSGTGLKFAEIQKSLRRAFDETKIIMDEIGANQYRPGYWCIDSGVSAILFPKGFDVPDWYKKVNNSNDEYYPKGNRKEGKALKKKLDALHTIDNQELNDCVGFVSSGFQTIGAILSSRSEYYLFSLGDDWEYTPPEDCIEITTTEYKELAKKD